MHDLFDCGHRRQVMNTHLLISDFVPSRKK
jgi:hypothetical protein